MDDLVAKVSLRLAACALLTVLASAQGVRVVTPAGDLNFTDIQPAVDAAGEGDVLLVAEGSYSAFTIDGKSLSIHALPGAAVVLQGSASVVHLGPDQCVLLDGVRVHAADGNVALRLHDNEGLVRLQDCELRGGGDPGNSGGGLAGIEIIDCAGVALLQCDVLGGIGLAGLEDYFPATDGGPGIVVERGAVALHESTALGGEGGRYDCFDMMYCYYQPGRGGRAVVTVYEPQGALTSEVFTSGSHVQGGDGGIKYYKYNYIGQAWGGDAVYLAANTVLDAVDCTFVGGTPNGDAVVGPGSFNPLPTKARSVQAESLVVADQSLDVTYQGEPLDTVWVSLSAEAGHFFQAGSWGVWLTGYPSFIPKSPLGAASPLGDLSFQLHGTHLAPGSARRELVFQGLAAATWGHRFLSGARHVLVLSPTVGPDCNGNGVSDYLDVIQGTSPDANHNLIPDECPGG